METRLLLCQLTGQTLRRGMDLLGIGTPERL
ncbi:DALR anticodon-binding domain-containing protein [Kitasatospora sp. NPDC056327]